MPCTITQLTPTKKNVDVVKEYMCLACMLA